MSATKTTPQHPPCPGGCGCRLGTDDADRFECGCDGGCCDEWPVPPVITSLPRRCPPLVLTPEQRTLYLADLEEQHFRRVRAAVDQAAAERGLPPEPWPPCPCPPGDGAR